MLYGFIKRAGLCLSVVCALTFVLGTPLEAKAAKDVVLAVPSTFTTTDPWNANDTLSQGVAKSFYEGLMGFDETMTLRPVLAESFTVSENGLEYVFKLRNGVKFHDGTDFNAEAVKVNFDRVTDPANKLKRYNLYANIAKTEVLGDLTVVFTLKEPFSAFINQLGHPSAGMISPAALKKYGKEIAFNPVGTGPYVFEEWIQTDHLKGVKNKNYWRAGLPKIDSITWLPVVDNSTRANVLRTGEAHFTSPVPFEMAEIMKKDKNLNVVVAPSIVHRYVSMNVQHKPFNDVRVRHAINYAINKKALAKVAFNGYAIPAEGVLPKGVAFNTKLGPWPYDPQKAKALLKEAGYENGFETELWSGYNHTTGQKVIQFLQQQLAQVGIKAKVRALEAGQRVELVESSPDAMKAPVRMYYVGWSSSTGEADWAIRPLLAGESKPPRLYNTAYYDNPIVNQGLKDALIETDPAKKATIYAMIQAQIWNDAPWAFLVTQQSVSASNKKLSGMHYMPDGSFFFENIDLK